MPYLIESDGPLQSAWLPRPEFSQTFQYRGTAIMVAAEGANDPSVEEVQVVDTETGEIVWRSE